MGLAWAKTHVEPQKHFGRVLPTMEHLRTPQYSLDELYTSPNVPQDIRDLETIVATINITESFNVEDVDVGVTITHPWVRDLTISLERDSIFIDTVFVRRDTVWDSDTTFHWDSIFVYLQDSTVASVLLLDLFPGDSIVNMTDCWFDDDAGRGIYSGLPPFTGGFRPLQRVDNMFAGHDALGEWRLKVRDRFLGDEGVLESFRLEINGIASLTGTISNSVTNTPIANATVLVIDTALADTIGRTTTLTNGTYSFSRFDAGNYRVYASATSYSADSVDGVVITQGQTTVQNLSLVPQLNFVDVPLPDTSIFIPDTTRITVALDVSELTGTILDCDVTVNISHTYMADLFISLQHPLGDSITLFDPPLAPDIGDNMIDCRFDDEAITPIGVGTGPFTGFFQPVEALSGLDSLTPNGTWHLIVQDYGIADTGFVNSFILHFQLPTSAADDPETALPESFKLHPAYPNPFNATVNFTLDVLREQDVQLKVFDITGRLVETLYSGKLTTGSHKFYWAPIKAASGIYFVRAEATDVMQTMKIVLLK